MEENSSTILDLDLVTPEQENPNANIASQGKRFLNMILDTISYYILVFCVAFILGAAGVIDESTGKGFMYLIAFATMFVYFTVMEATFGKTIGKMVTRTRVVDEEGHKITFGTTVVRSLCRFVPLDAFSFLSSHPIGWHDSWSDTRVINDRKKS